MSLQDQPYQATVGLVFANGVLTITGTAYINQTVAASLADELSAVTTVTNPGTAGTLLWSTVITPNSAIVSADNTVALEIGNPNNG